MEMISVFMRSKSLIGQALHQGRVMRRPFRALAAILRQRIAPVYQADVVAVPDVAAFSVSGRRNRNDAVVRPFFPSDNRMGQPPFRAVPAPGVAAGNRKIAEARWTGS